MWATTHGAVTVGREERRFWDDRLQVSRAAQASDPARECFDAFVPHPVNGWEPDLRADTWRQVSMATERCADLANATGSQPLAAEWLLDRSESIASSTIEEIRPSARRVARAEAQLELFSEMPPAAEMQALRNVAATQRADEVMGGGALPVSAALMRHKQRYFDALDEVRTVCPPDDPRRSRGYRSWIELLAQATAHACTLRERLTKHVKALSQRWTGQARQAGIRSSSAAAKLLDSLPRHPVVTADSASSLLSVDLRTAQRAVARLSKLGILEQRSAGRRNRVFECSDMMDAFTESVREQPASNLTLSAPVGTPGPPLPNSDGVALDSGDGNICGATTSRGRRCGHPQPRPGGQCPAGHRRG